MYIPSGNHAHPQAAVSAGHREVAIHRGKGGEESAAVQARGKDMGAAPLPLSTRALISGALPPGISARIDRGELISVNELFGIGMKALHEDMQGIFSETGIDPDGLELSIGQSGDIEVRGDHPMKDELEARINGDRDLAKRFRALSATAGLLNAAERARELHDEYDKNQGQAVRMYSSVMFNTAPPVEPVFRFTADVTEMLMVSAGNDPAGFWSSVTGEADDESVTAENEAADEAQSEDEESGAEESEKTQQDVA